MAERAADGAAVARLAMAEHDRLVQQRALRLDEVGEFEVALARHGADLERAAGLPDAGHALDPVEVDDMVGQHEAHVEHRHQRLAAGQELGVVERAQQAYGLGERFRIVILERGRLHRGPDATGAASIGKRRDREQPPRAERCHGSRFGQNGRCLLRGHGKGASAGSDCIIPHLVPRRLHRLDDVLVAGAAAEIRRQHVEQLLVADVRIAAPARSPPASGSPACRSRIAGRDAP